ncbi:MAG: DUF3849 domain-containing protein, partial [Clostridia bacterium]|nr:DUF3849 domain-containing protein [Clostridia bacterium]
MQTDGCSDDELKTAQWTLNDRYDRFVKRYGYLNNQTNVRLFKDDGDSALLFACENSSEDKKTYTKAEIFTKRTIRPYVAVTQTDDCFEALQISKNERGKVDIAYIEELTKKDYDTVLFELGNAVFRNPFEVDINDKYSGFETAEQYLSGNVVKKLQVARRYAETDKAFEKNVKELERVQPVPLTASEISVRMGASWIDKDYYKQFLMEILNLGYWCREGIEIYHNPHDSSWRVDKAAYIRNNAGLLATQVYGTSRANAFRLFEACLNLKEVNIYDVVEDSDGKEKRVLNQAETLAAREKQNKIKDEFKEWIFENPERRNDLEETYNRIFNQIRLPTYDGSYLKFPGMNPAIELKPHQKNAIARMMPGNNTLLHHVVGSGKTYTCIAGIMKQKQLGLINKAMVTVPNHLVEQWGSDWLHLYPDAKILIATKEDLEKNNRRKFVSKVALGDWDGIIIAQSSFAKIPISTERQIRKIREEIDRIDESISSQWDTSNMPDGAVKKLERIKKNKEVQLKRLMDDSNKDNVLKFEDLGVDYLVVDEAHYYKNKFLFTKMNNVAGISTTASQRASDMELKIDYINELHGGDKGVVFATGTPISNSMTEMYTMQSYLQKQSLAEAGLDFFDAWAADFGETVLSLELAPSGQGYKPRTRFAKFTNLPELLTMYRSFADVQTSDMVKLDVPEAEHIVVNLKPSDKVIELAEEIADRAEAIYEGGIDPHMDNMLKVTSDGKKLALDARCMDPLSDDEPVSKLNACAERIYEIWNDTKDFKGTQIVFCDLSTPKKAFEDYEYGKDFDAYNDLKYKLVEKGIPEEEVAFIHDAGNDKQKQSLFDDVNSGKVRVLIGSTEKCGAGTNVQKRLVALHHLDTPYRPSDMEQREGRIIRQGNSNDKVQIFTYVTERTFDSYSYQILENKQRFISQINRGDLTVREAEDIDETTLSYAEIKAITAANPKIKRKMEVDGEVSRLRVLEGQYKKNLYALQDKVNKDLPERIRRQEQLLENIRKDIELIKDNYNPDPEEFSISVNGKVYTDRKESGKALTEALYHSRPETVVGEYCGFKISMNPIEYLANERSITIAGAGQYEITVGQSESGNLTRLDNFIKDFAAREDVAKTRLENLKRDYEVAKSQLNVPFEHKEKLAELIKEQAALNAELDLNRREEVIIDSDEESDDGEQYMSVLDSADMSVRDSTVQPVARKTKRKPLQQADFKVYNAQRQKEPDSYIFIRNGDGYELTGKHAERIAAENGLNTITDTINGEEVTVLHLNNKELDIEVRKLVDGGEKVVIIEPDFAKKEEILETEEERQKIEENEQPIIDYKAEVSKLVEQEFKDFKNDELKKTPEEIFYDNYVIHVKTELSNFLQDGDLDPKYYRVLLEEKGHILDSLYDGFLDYDYSSVNNYSDTQEFIEQYCEDYYDDMLKKIEAEENSVIVENEIAEEITEPTEPIKQVEEQASKYTPIYLKTAAEAFKDGRDSDEGKLYRDSNSKSKECIAAITKGINENYDYSKYHFDTDFAKDIIAEYGQERVNYVLATVMQNHKGDGRYSEGNREWASTIPISESEDVRHSIDTNAHSTLMNSFIDEVRRLEKENENKTEETMEQDKYVSKTARGDTVVDIKKGADGRNFAVIQRKNDYVVAIGYNTKDGSWEQGRYDYETYESANEVRDGYASGKTPVTKWYHPKISTQALINTYDKSSQMRMPKFSEYKGYTYFVFNNRIKDSDILSDLQSDSREKAYELNMSDSETYTLKNRQSDEIELTGEELAKAIDNTTASDYAVKWYDISLPQDAVRGVYDKSTLLAMPDTSKYAGRSFYIPTSLISEDKESEGKNISISLPEDFTVNVSSRNKEQKDELTAKEFYEECQNAEYNELDREYPLTNEENGEKKVWLNVLIPEAARIAEYDKSTLFKMPKGQYEGYAYYVPNGLLTEKEDGIILSLPEDFTITAKDNKNGASAKLIAADYIKEVEGKTEEDYYGYQRQDKFTEREKVLRNSVPDEMKSRPNWVIVRTRENENGKLDKFLISPVTGKYAESNNPETWTDFDTACKYAKENGGVTLAYAIDGEDNICCVDLDHCIDDNRRSALAEEVLSKAGKTYMEISLSGKGLHIFGTTDGMDLRAFSKDGDLEFYQKTHFIAMTGDGAGYYRLESFDKPEMKELLERKCAKRTAWTGEGKGVEGLSIMTDREVVERACSG